MGLRHAYGHAPEAQLLQLGYLTHGRRFEYHAVGMVDALRDGLYLLRQGEVILVGVFEGRSTAAVFVSLFAEAHHLISQSQTAFATLRPHLGKRNVHTQLVALRLYQIQLCLGISREGIDGYHTGQLVDLGDVLHMLEQVRQARLERLQVLRVEIFLGHAAMVLEGAHRSHHHDGIRLEPC